MHPFTIKTQTGQTCELAASYRDSGKDLLLFVHGLGCSRKVFDAAWKQPHLKDFSLLSIDLLGFGDSPKPRDFSYTVEAHGYVIAQIVRQFPDRRVHFVGSSMGPIIGLAMPKDALNTLRSFANIEARLVVEDCGNSAKAAALTFEEFLENFWLDFKEKVQQERHSAYDLEHTLPEAFYRGAQSVVKLALSGWSYKHFIELKVPKVYFYGDDEKSRSMKILPLIQDQVPIKKITNSGHFVMIDNPEALYEALSVFVRSVHE